MEKYLKLGEKASSFYDPTSRFGIVNQEVKVVTNAVLKSPRVKRFLKGGGLTFATKEEYNEYTASMAPAMKEKVVVEEKVEKKTLKDMTIAELQEHIKVSGWEQEDIDKGLSIKKKDDIIEFIEITEIEYEE